MADIMTHLPAIGNGLLRTVEYSIVAIIAATIFGLIAALMKLSEHRAMRVLPTVYVEIFRGTPLLVQLFFIVLGLPVVLPLNQWFGQDFYPIFGAALCLALNEGAYVTEIIRAGIQGVNKGQREAAHSIGMTKLQTMRYIVLPQAFKRMIPPLVNQFAQTIKDTSLAAAVSVVELTYTGEIIISENFEPFKYWAIVALLYFVVIFIITRIAGYLERRLQVDKR